MRGRGLGVRFAGHEKRVATSTCGCGLRWLAGQPGYCRGWSAANVPVRRPSSGSPTYWVGALMVGAEFWLAKNLSVQEAMMLAS
jgi:hypothetical protein